MKTIEKHNVMKNKIILICLALCAAATACSTYKAGMEQAQYDPIPNKIPTLEYDYSYVNVLGGNAQFINNVVNSEVERNIMKEGENPLGTLEVKCEKFHLKSGLLFPILSGGTLFIGNLLGMPFSTGKIDLELSFTIKNLNGDIIRTYDYSQTGKSALGFYYGEDVSVKTIELCRKIMDEFKRDVSFDYDDISEALHDPANIGDKSLDYELLADAVAQKIETDSPGAVSGKSKENTVIKKSDVDINIPVTSQKAENTFVLIIANENYSYVDNVKYALHDGEVFREYCIKTLGIPERQVWLYKDATAGVISGGVDKMVQAMSIFENAKAIVYYCGHGIPDEKTAEAYIVPTDGKGTNTETCYSLNKLYKALAQSQATSVTYFLDACFSGADREGSMLVAARGIAREAKQEKLEGRTVVFSAASGDETAMPFEDKSHGLFTYYLLKKLQETKGQVNYGELAEYLKDNVRKEAFLTNEKLQTPVIATSAEMQSAWKSMTLK